MRPGGAIGLLVAVLVAGGRAAFAQEEPEEKLEAVDRQLETSQQELERLRDQKTSVLDELDRVEGERRALDEALKRADKELAGAHRKLDAAKKEEDAAREVLVAELDLLAPRLRARYRLTQHRRAGLLLTAQSAAELLRRKRALDRVMERDLDMLAQARAAEDEVRRKREKVEEVQREIADRAREAGERRAEAKRKRQELAALHASLLKEQVLQEKAVAELQRQHVQLSRLIDDLQSGGASTAEFAKARGRMPFPTRGYIEVAFGKVVNPKFNTVTHQKGLDIRAPEGTDVVAVGAGEIVHAGPFRGYGNLVILDHGGGYHSLYAHLSSIELPAGERVRPGEVIGQVGDTGSLKGAYLYFEIREKGRPVDPKGWLAPPP